MRKKSGRKRRFQPPHLDPDIISAAHAVAPYEVDDDAAAMALWPTAAAAAAAPLVAVVVAATCISCHLKPTVDARLSVLCTSAKGVGMSIQAAITGGHGGS